MPDERFSHLFIPGPSATRDDYSSPRQGGEGPRLRVQDRPTHAAKLKSALQQAWKEAVDRQAVAFSSRKGVYLEFLSEPGFDLTLKSLESKSAGIRLLTVHTEGLDGSETTRATVYVPADKSSHFLQKVSDYANKDNKPKADGTSTPLNAPLVNSIRDVRSALLEQAFWQGELARLPTTQPDWVEAWLSSTDLGVLESFRETCSSLGIELGNGQLTFPERTVLLIRADKSQLESLIEHFDFIAEFRAANEVATFFIEQDNKDQIEWVEDLLKRTSFTNDNNVAVLVLDHGVNNGHRLLEPVLLDDDCHAAEPDWGSSDDEGHGTLMAGAAAYGDLGDKLQSMSEIHVQHQLESAKILPPPPAKNPKQLWGHFTARGISQAEIQAPSRKRIICMAVTSKDEVYRGRPTSWSGEIDALASGATDEIQRLIILSAGNVADPKEWAAFPDSNKTSEVQDPAQAWNALTVGAFTEKTRMSAADLDGFEPIAEAGDLSPYSSTSLTWPHRKWPIKPEVLFEGGNVARDSEGNVYDADDLQLLSTHHDPQVAQFSAFNATSAAAAQAGHMAARIQAAYPSAWPETIRGLIVHAADWTDIQRQQYLTGENKGDYYNLLRVCGYGVPDLSCALSCASNALSLIAQETIQPFCKHESQSRRISKDMHIYRLPWPVDVLRDLGEVEIKMRVTLSYFIEPSPGEVGWKDRYRYASHALRFELNGPGESEDEFIQRINRKAREEDEHPGTAGAGEHWCIGEARNVGSIHSDIWTGQAAELASSNRIAVHPAVGWWRERHHLGLFEKKTRYALIVSFEVPDTEIDIYTDVAIALGVNVPIEIEI